MPNAATTQTSSASETTGAALALAYGYVWVTGKRHAYTTLQETGNNFLDFTRAGIWLLGEGEWDGPLSLWINNLLTWRSSFPYIEDQGDFILPYNPGGFNYSQALDYPLSPLVFNFHSGCDSIIGSGLVPSSYGPDQGVDILWTVFPPAVPPLAFSRIAYYTILRKQPILYQQNNNPADPSQWTDVAPIGMWRALRCRLFDADGNVTGYAFTRNPVWHWVDLVLRRELFPDYNLPYQVGPDPLPAAVSARFNWSKIYASAQSCNQPLSNGQPRFTGDYVFSQQTSLQAIKTKILRACRAFEQESQGQIAIIVDQPRPSVFTVSRQHILPGTWEATDRPLTTFGNRLLSSFRDVLIPACNNILSISNADQVDPTVTTDSIPPTGTPQPHPFNVGDWIWIGGTDTIFDGEWQVSSVPAVINPGTSSEVDPTTFTIARKGDNYPTSVGAVGCCGLEQSRFKERTPEFWHKNNMLARGSYALGLARQRNKVKDALDFDTSTYDQVSRVSRYERDRNLGFDVAPYIAPARVRFKMSLFAKDANGAVACGLETGDVVTLDNTVRYPYAGTYEVMDGLTKTPPMCSVDSSDGSISRSPDPNSGEISVFLQTYDEDYFYDTSDTNAAGWPNVPGSYPGNDTSFSAVPLANGGNFVFFTGQLPSGSHFQLPSTGYPAGNMLAWASPAGTNIAFHSACYVLLCDVDSNRMLTLQYEDASGTPPWGGDVNYACLTWLSPDVTNTDANGMTWLPLTLLGGEQILFGRGVLANGSTIALPAGWTTDKCFARAYIHDQTPTSDIMYLCGAWVDAGFVVHCATQDHAGNTTYGNATVLVFAWKNNMGTVVTTTVGGETWLKFPLTDGSAFGVISSPDMANGSVLQPADAIPSTIEPMVGPSDNFYTSGGGHAQGVGSCYLDGDNVIHCTFNDGSGDTWNSTADLFATYTQAAVTPIPIMRIRPMSFVMPAAGVRSLVASLNGAAPGAVTWSVDGIPGGNATVGTIDAYGNYGAPNIGGLHTITATSVSDPSFTASATVAVGGAAYLDGDVICDALGNPISFGDDFLYLE